MEHARLVGALWEEAEALGGTLGSLVYGPEPAQDVARRCEEILAGVGVGSIEARALRALASVRAMEGRFDVARELAERARSILEELGMRMRAAFVSQTLGSIETLARDHIAAEREYRVGYEAAVELKEQGFLSTIAAELAHALIELGKLDDAETLTKVSEEIGAQDDAATQVTWRSARARIVSMRGDSSTATALARRAVAIAEKTDDLNMQADTLVSLGEVLRAAGRFEEATVAFTRAFKRYRAKGNVVGAEDALQRRSSLGTAV
jgi:tetratricopeptide (TPR) repeat protein